MNNGLVKQLLGYASEPWKVVALVLSMLILGAGYAAFEQRAQIAQFVLESTVKPRLEPSRFPAAAEQLIAETHADLVLFTRVDMTIGQLTGVDGRRTSDPAWRPKVEPRNIFDVATPLQLAAIISGQVVCDDVPAIDSHRIDVELGMRRRCLVAVPPVIEILVGGLSIYWLKPLSAVQERGAQLTMLRAGMRLATW